MSFIFRVFLLTSFLDLFLTSFAVSAAVTFNVGLILFLGTAFTFGLVATVRFGFDSGLSPGEPFSSLLVIASTLCDNVFKLSTINFNSTIKFFICNIPF